MQGFLFTQNAYFQHINTAKTPNHLLVYKNFPIYGYCTTNRIDLLLSVS